MKNIISVAAIAASLSAGVAHAATITTFSDRTSYESATGAQEFFLDFDAHVLEVGVDGDFAGLVDFGTIGATNPDLVNLNTYVGDAGDPTTVNNVGVLKGDLYSAHYGIGFDILSGSIEGVRIYDATGGLIGDALLTTTNAFIGVVSDIGISSFELIPNVFDATTSVPGGYDRVFIDNFSADGAAAVPLPAAGWLLVAALGALGLKRKRS